MREVSSWEVIAYNDRPFGVNAIVRAKIGDEHSALSPLSYSIVTIL